MSFFSFFRSINENTQRKIMNKKRIDDTQNKTKDSLFIIRLANIGNYIYEKNG